jgi:universal stress protein E
MTFRRILVDLDATAAAHPAVDRALELARRCGASVKLVDVMSVPASARSYLSGETEQMVAGARREHLASLAKGITDVPVQHELLTGRPAQAIIDETVKGDFDLVVRSHARDLAAEPRTLGAIDMQLFRSCPSTVWAVGPGAQQAPRKVVAAIHANPGDDEEQQLNARIIAAAAEMAPADGLIVFQAWDAFAADMLRSRYSDEEFTGYVKAAADAARSDVDAFLKTVDLPKGTRTELREGMPEEVLPAYVVSEGIDLVVMGTIARTGIAGLIMGNTAERLLQRLTCSVMAVKPEGFQPPVT